MKQITALYIDLFCGAGGTSSGVEYARLGGKTFEPYDPARCLAFVQDVMQQTRDRATVYWKQSFRDFIGGTGKHRLFTDDELHKIFDDYPNAVGKDWSMFNPQNR